jgi:adenosylcobinamide kinase/adenosylcobinamide-phosphate guanylyltransferase
VAAKAPPRPHSLTLVLGAARSGKSRWAEHLASGSSLAVTYLATASPRPDDAPWQARLQLHRQRRPADWGCLEIGEPEQLASCLEGLAASQLALVDSLGSWVAAGLHLDGPTWLRLCDQLQGSLISTKAAVVLVSEQTGWGLVPPTAIGGLFRDRLGALERRLVAISGSCWLVVAGRALELLPQRQAVPSD